MDWKMLNTDDGNRIRGSRGDAVVVDPAVLIDLAEYLESITSVVYWEGKARVPPKVSPSRKSSTTLLGLSGLTLAMAFIPHDFIGASYRHTVICNGN